MKDERYFNGISTIFKLEGSLMPAARRGTSRPAAHVRVSPAARRRPAPSSRPLQPPCCSSPPFLTLSWTPDPESGPGSSVPPSLFSPIGHGPSLTVTPCHGHDVTVTSDASRAGAAVAGPTTRTPPAGPIRVIRDDASAGRSGGGGGMRGPTSESVRVRPRAGVRFRRPYWSRSRAAPGTAGHSTSQP